MRVSETSGVDALRRREEPKSWSRRTAFSLFAAKRLFAARSFVLFAPPGDLSLFVGPGGSAAGCHHEGIAIERRAQQQR